MDTGSFGIHIKSENFYEDIADDVDTLNYSKDDKRPLPIVQNEKEIGLFKDKLGGTIMNEFVELRAKIAGIFNG